LPFVKELLTTKGRAPITHGDRDVSSPARTAET